MAAAHRQQEGREDVQSLGLNFNSVLMKAGGGFMEGWWTSVHTSSRPTIDPLSDFRVRNLLQEHLFLMGYRTQPAYVNKPGEKARGAKEGIDAGSARISKTRISKTRISKTRENENEISNEGNQLTPKAAMQPARIVSEVYL
ncbi:hypothetical protein D4764_14G0003170 [Takifugu flavidus]|uniref:Uncharacterized protein n=1 Tax=Takifugu flavidus TaxID=433684 RepID=A0A5C6P5E9_9TELE|nr:hypothetical protein D4764_14G0003170 [Takifugu flavidus]